MNEIKIHPLPEGAVVHGHLYDDPEMVYELGDVLEVSLTNGMHVDLEWNEEDKPTPFKITIWVGWFGNQIAEFMVADRFQAAKAVSKTACQYATCLPSDIVDLVFFGFIEGWE
jgi:hypothetical protein